VLLGCACQIGVSKLGSAEVGLMVREGVLTKERWLEMVRRHAIPQTAAQSATRATPILLKSA